MTYFLNFIGKATYMRPAEMVPINIKHRHDIEVEMIQHFSHGWVSLIGQKGLKDKGDILLIDGYQSDLREKQVWEILSV